MSRIRVVILGAGPAGLAAAFRLARRGLAWVTVLEESDRVGGNAGSFELAGLSVDYGSHRLHPACDREVLGEIRDLLGDDLLDRPRRGRIRLRGRWIGFPLKPLDLALRLPPGLVFGAGRDLALKLLRCRNAPSDGKSFASVLESGLGPTICREFYFPYARKLWGLEPEEISERQARRRVSTASFGTVALRLLSAVPALGLRRRGHFFYPRQGFGQIPRAYLEAAKGCGVEVRLNARVKSVEIEKGAVASVRVSQDGETQSIPADLVWSTIPITSLARCINPELPAECTRAAESISFRAMILVYLVLRQDRFSPFDAHYFPEPAIPLSRLSEPKNYGGGSDTGGSTVLCAELPCATDGPYWDKSDAELAELTCTALEAAGLPVRAPIQEVVTRRLRHAYPIYRRGYESHFDRLDRELCQIDGLLTFGRQGLFVHDNTHHALFMAYSAVACLGEDGRFDKERWQEYRQAFESHVVED